MGQLNLNAESLNTNKNIFGSNEHNSSNNEPEIKRMNEKNDKEMEKTSPRLWL